MARLTYYDLVKIIREIESLHRQFTDTRLSRKIEDPDKESYYINPKWWDGTEKKLADWARRLANAFPDEPVELRVSVGALNEDDE